MRVSRRCTSSDRFRAIDIFAGGGGLTVGLKRAGFAVAGAVEIERHAFSTYKVNHPEVRALRQDVRTVTGRDLRRMVPRGRVDLLVGCPPCQGFSSLTAKYRRRDPRNDLVLEMGRLVVETRPRAVMMENVPRLASKGRPLLDALLNELRGHGYHPNVEILQVADFGVPQFRKRLVLLAGRGFRIEMPTPTHSKDPRETLKAWRTVRDAIRSMPAPSTFAEAQKAGGPQKANWHVVRTLSEANVRRLRRAVPGATWPDIPAHLRPTCHTGNYRGFLNVYGRMDWDSVAPTITGGCCTLSKGRFGHPDEQRTISVREAALLQTLPKRYVIDTPYMEYATAIVGNALPCRFAEVLARACKKAIAERFGAP